MFYSIAIPGILQAWPGASIDKEISSRSANDNGSAASASRGERTSQSRERAHTSMTMNKSTDSSNINTALYASDVHVLDFGMLYEKFKRPVHSYIYRLLGSHDDADDLTQEVFMRAYVAWNDLYDRDNLSSWLYRIATNLCIDQLRRRKRISWWPLVRRNHEGEQLTIPFGRPAHLHHVTDVVTCQVVLQTLGHALIEQQPHEPRSFRGPVRAPPGWTRLPR